MHDISVLIGGRAGDGINSAGAIVAQLFNQLGYRIYMYFDYPSLIRGGHNFTIIRAAEMDIGACRDHVDFVLALNRETVERHRGMFAPDTVIISNADLVKDAGTGIPVGAILKQEDAPAIMGNSAIIGGFAKAAGIDWKNLESVFRSHIPKGTEKNLAVARRAYDQVDTKRSVERGAHPPLPLMSGNESVGFGLILGGLEAYVSYPMTPSSGILHFLAEQKEKFGLTVVHPENEIAVILMALGFAYAGKKSAVGTSGGGFCLITEGLSLAGMAEIPLVLAISQRTGPSTGLPTYTGQSELRFILHAGQGEFPRLIVAPGDTRESVYWSAVAMKMAWEYQIPAFILVDKTLSEGTYSTDLASLPGGPPAPAVLSQWDNQLPYKRYANTSGGVSPLAFPGMKDAVVKVNSYVHEEDGITSEDGDVTVRMTQKRMYKEEQIRRIMQEYPAVGLGGIPDAKTALVSWGSTKGVCSEVALRLGLRGVRPIVLTPFPEEQMKRALTGVQRIIFVEENATAQLAGIAAAYGIHADDTILRYDGRPFTFEELLGRVEEVVK